MASYTTNLAAFFTTQGLNKDIESIEDLINQNTLAYATIYNSEEMSYFKRIADIETLFHTVWKEMSLNDSLSQVERTEMSVWEYPVDDKYTKVWRAMIKTGMPKDLTQAISRIRDTPFALIAHARDIALPVILNCDLIKVTTEFAKRDYAIGLPHGSPLKAEFNQM